MLRCSARVKHHQPKGRYVYNRRAQAIANPSHSPQALKLRISHAAVVAKASERVIWHMAEQTALHAAQRSVQLSEPHNNAALGTHGTWQTQCSAKLAYTGKQA